MVQLSYLYLTARKIIALTILTSVGKVMSLLFNVLSRFVIAFLPRSKHLLNSWLQLLSSVILELKKIKSATVSTFPPSFCHEVIWSHLSIINVSNKLQSLLLKVREESEETGLKLNIQKTMIMASGPITSWQIDGEKNGNNARFYFLGPQNHHGQWLQPWN